MTREEWREDISEMSDLISFCIDNDLDDYIGDIYDWDTYCDCVEEDISDRFCNWQDLRDYLDDLPSGHDYYRRNGSFDYEAIDYYTFQEVKDGVEEALNDMEFFDEEEEMEPEIDPAIFEEEEPEPEPEPEQEYEPLPVDGIDLLCTMNAGIVAENRKPEPEPEEEPGDEPFDVAMQELAVDDLLNLPF